MYTPLDKLLNKDEKRVQMDQAQHEVRSNLINQQSSYMDKRSSIKQSIAQMDQGRVQMAPMIEKRMPYNEIKHVSQPERTDHIKNATQLEQQRTEHMIVQFERQKEEQKIRKQRERINNQMQVIKDIYYSQDESTREHYREQDLGPAVNQLIDLLNSYTFSTTQVAKVVDNISTSDYSLYAPLASPTFTGTVRLSPTVSFTSTLPTGTDVYTLSIDDSNNIIRTGGLSNYVLLTTLASTLSSYVTSNSLSSTLSSYVTSSVLSSTLSTYVTSSALSSTLSSFVTSSYLSSILAGYVTSSTLSNYVTSTDLSSTLSNYVTSSTLANYSYVTSTSLSSTLSSYVTSSSLSTSITTNELRINTVSAGTYTKLLGVDSYGNVIQATLTTLVPYTGATSNVNLNNMNLTGVNALSSVTLTTSGLVTANTLKLTSIPSGTQSTLLAVDSSGNVIQGTAPTPTQLLTTEITAGSVYYYPAMVNSQTTGNKSYFVENPTSTWAMYYSSPGTVAPSVVGEWNIPKLRIGINFVLSAETSFSSIPNIQSLSAVSYALGINSFNNLVAYVPSNQTAMTATTFNADYNLLFTSSGTSLPNITLNVDAGQNLKYNPSTDRLTVPNLTVGTAATINDVSLTGTPTAPTATAGTNTTQIATTAFVQNAVNSSFSSPALTGVPTAPTATAGTNTTQIATTAFVQTALNSSSSYLPLTGGTVSGNITVTGTSILSGTLDVSGNTTLYGTTTTVNGALNVNDSYGSGLRINNASGNTGHLLHLIQSSTSTTTSFPHQSGIAFVGNELQVPGATGNASHTGLGLSLYYSRVNNRWLALSDLSLNRNNTNATLTMGVKGTTGTGLASVTTDFTTYKPLTIDASSLAIGCSTTINGTVSATTFSGSLSGNAASATTAAGLNGNPNISVNNLNASWLNVTDASSSVRFITSGGTNYIQSGNTNFTAAADLVLCGHNANATNVNITGKLRVSWYTNIAGSYFGALGGSASWFNTGWSNGNISISAYQYIHSDVGFLYSSDRRIKTNISPISSSLSLIKELKPVTYDYIDKVANRNVTQFGFIAQDVKQVAECAVELIRSKVPDIYVMATLVRSNEVYIVHDLIKVGDELVVYTINDKEEKKEKDTQNTEHYTVTVLSYKNGVMCIDKEIGMTGDKVFLYGHMVNDFHNMKTDAIVSISVAAIKDIDQKIHTQQDEINSLHSEISDLKSQLASLKATVDALIARI
jgi:hypothetical protein